jgi:hypothetical protein
VDELHDNYPDLVKWAWSDMQQDSHGDVVRLLPATPPLSVRKAQDSSGGICTDLICHGWSRAVIRGVPGLVEHAPQVRPG